ncbi:MAG: hypothetical protein IPM51_03575 [Sphingobacteriaceae bacterium]|nr:hypothetical protein [Sphingobacteriaceae bacterium]
MKKLISFCLVINLLTLKSQTRFFQGIGIFASGTQSMHNYKNTTQDNKDFANDNPSNFVFANYYPQSHISRENFSWGAGLFLEFIDSDRIRWQTEATYMKKSVLEKEVIDPFFGTRAGNFSANKYTYIQWNNYLKFLNIGLGPRWYGMLGVRLEYLLNSSASVFTSVAGSFPKFWFSGDAALGYEFPIARRLNMFVEYHWNPDIIRHKHNNIKVRNRTFELRVGIVYRPRKKRIDDCNAPRYKGPAY